MWLATLVEGDTVMAVIVLSLPLQDLVALS
jgi:hypothetical protein